MNIIVGNALPYANGLLHIGRVSSWMPGDAIARYHRAKGDNVIFISGSDCHGELVLKKAKELNKSPKVVSSHFHKDFEEKFKELDFSFDYFTKTDSDYHKENVKEFIKTLYNRGYIYKLNIEEDFCEHCNESVGDRFIENNIHTVCGKKIIKKSVDKLFFKLSTFEDYLKGLVSKDLSWRENALKLSKKYLDEGLRDKPINRDIEWGIDVPIEGFTDQKIYVWIEAVMAYLTATKKCIEEKGEKFEDYWGCKDSRLYLLHGKENIPFHTITFPAIIAGLGYENTNIRILSSEHMDLEGKKFSTNRNWVIWLDDIIDRYDSDTIRYYFLTHGAERRNSNFTWKDFINVHNNELLGIYGNFINRSLSFIEKYYNGNLEKQRINKSIQKQIEETYKIVSSSIERGNLREATKSILNLAIKGSEYFDSEKPWILFGNDPMRCKEVIYNCSIIVANLSNLLNPIIPKTADKVRKILGIKEICFNPIILDEINVGKVELLFNRIDKKKISEEVFRLKNKRKI